VVREASGVLQTNLLVGGKWSVRPSELKENAAKGVLQYQTQKHENEHLEPRIMAGYRRLSFNVISTTL